VIYDPEQVARLQTSDRWSAATRTRLDANAAEMIATWDPDLLREPRVLVPVDVQALVVSPKGLDTLVLPGPLTPGVPDEAAAVDGPVPFADASARPPGVHLHWAMPDALLRGRLRDPRGEPGGGLGLAALPDRWAVVRLLAPAEGDRTVPVHVRGWLLDAATSTVRDLATGTDGPPLPGTGSGRSLAPAELTGTAGGTLTWTGAYDACFARFAWHDPLDDLLADPELGGALPGGPEAGAASYLVVGWWSLPDLDPLDGVRTEGGLAERVAELGWRIADGGGREHLVAAGARDRAGDLGIPIATRFDRGAPRARGETAAPSTAAPTGAALEGSVLHAAGAGLFAREAGRVIRGEQVAVEASTLAHGAVIGVPVDGREPAVDLRPPADQVRVALGEHTDDVVAAVLTAGTGAAIDGVEQRRAVERLLAAFSGRLLDRLGAPDGLVDVDEYEHARGFAAVDSGEPPILDRVLVRGGQVPPRPERPRVRGVGSALEFRIDRKVTAYGLLTEEPTAVTVSRADELSSTFANVAGRMVMAGGAAGGAGSGTGVPADPGAAAQTVTPGAKPLDERTVEHPTPPRHVALDPVVAVSGAHRSLRHGGDGRGNADGRLRCRRGSHVAQSYSGLLPGADLLPSMGSGALPAEALALAREVLLLSPHLAAWLGARASEGDAAPGRGAATTRIAAEMALRYDATGAYTALAGPRAVGGGGTLSSGGFSPLGDRAATTIAVHEAFRRHSLLEGVEPDLVGITAWAQPWVPLWLEWEVDVDLARDLAGWRLGAVDLEPDDPTTPPSPFGTRTVTARVPLTTAPGDALAGAVARWLVEETARDHDDRGEADPLTQERLATLGRAADALDLAGAALSGIQEALLGLPATILRPRAPDGTVSPPAPEHLPELLVAGALTLRRARLVDAFGRTLELEPAGTVVPARLEVPGRPASLVRSPRFTAPARARLRPVDAAAIHATGAVDARVDEVEPAHQVSPVAGFLLPDHVDESVEVFAADGSPLGELLVEPIGGGVIWEPAPGRPLPAGAAPGAGLAPATQPLGWLAAGLVAADAAARRGRPAGTEGTPTESALAALLRAVDTTLWTCDPLAGAGTPALGGIVGRPIAVVRAVLALDVADDLDQLDLDERGRAARAAAYRDLAAVEVPVRLGEVTRTDDGLLGWFVDDDYSAVHVVDRAVRDLAREAGRQRGHLVPWGTTPHVPAEDPVTHPYVSPDDVVRLRPGVPRIVTLLTLPGLAIDVTSGVTPRQRIRLSRAWFGAVLDRLVPSVRVGPVLIDPGEVRLPPVAALGERQVLSHRDGPLSWRDDPILAATQSAILPDQTAVLREGWIRVDPAPAPEGEDRA
jgi:hypothetical protein